MESSKMCTPDIQYTKSKEKRENVLVFVRVRPINSHEKSKTATTVVDCAGQREVVVRERGAGSVSKTFTFDKVFGPHSKQIDVYRSVVSPLLEEVLQGYNCTVFAYGQTGTGKTFTMEGERSGSTHTWESDPLAGIVPRAMSQLFDELRVTSQEFTVRVSLVEMYNEEVYDLLSPSEDSKPKTVRLYEDSSKKGSVHIQGLEEVIVKNKHEVYAIMERGSLMRKTASTLLNANSSRSHTVFTVTVHIKESNMLGEDLLKIGKLHLVDLAGSENIGRSGAVDKRAREAGNINQSLLTLGRVITALVERTPHVPYRESKLTRLLQDSLGGKTKTSIIATVSPASINIEETLSTLDYAHRAKNIQNRPEVNQKLTKKAMLKEYTEEIERLRKDLLAAREKNGIYVDKENYDRMMSQIESQDQDLSEKIQYTKSLEEQVQQKDVECEEIKAVLSETKDDLEAANQVILTLKQQIAELSKRLTNVEMEKEEMKHLVKAHTQTEVKLTDEAAALLETASETTVNLEVLYNRLERKKNVESANYEAGKRFRTDFDDGLRTLAQDLNAFREEHSGFSGSQRLELEEKFHKKELMFDQMQQRIDQQTAQTELLMSTFVATMCKEFKENKKLLQQMLEKEQEETEKSKEQMFEHSDTVARAAEDYKQRLYMQSGKLNEFWESTYLIDLPTGATPQRKAYDFPRKLSATSPHARILNRYRTANIKFETIHSESEGGSQNSSNRSSMESRENNMPETVEEEEEIFLDENKDPLILSNTSNEDSSKISPQSSSSTEEVTPSSTDNSNIKMNPMKSNKQRNGNQNQNYQQKYIKKEQKKLLQSSNK